MAKLTKTIKRNLEDLLESKGFADIDIDSLWDNTLTVQENYDNIIGKEQKKTEYKKHEEEELERKKLEEEERLVKKEIAKSIRKIKKQKIANLDNFYGELKDLVNMLINGYSKSLFVVGDAGLGKTTTISSMLFGDGIKAKRVGGHISPMRLYATLYEYRDGYTLFFDDTESLLSSPVSIVLLKQALDTHEPRIVSWDSTRQQISLPSEFVFNSRVIFCLNIIPNDEGLKAIIDRSDCFEAKFSYADILRMMTIIANNDRRINGKLIKSEDRQNILRFIRNNSDITTEKLSLRTQYKIENYFISNPDKWKIMALKILSKKSDKLELIDDLEKGRYDTDTKLKRWNESTGLSRTQYYYYKREYKRRLTSCLHSEVI